VCGMATYSAKEPQQLKPIAAAAPR
jgi:hypothetical protein